MFTRFSFLTRYILAAGLSILMLSTCMQHLAAADKPRALYPYSFGGIEEMAVDDAVAMLGRLGYAGVVADAKNEIGITRLNEYLDWSEDKADLFDVVGIFISHKIHRSGLDTTQHKIAIDNLAAHGGGALWIWVEDKDDEKTAVEIDEFIIEIFEYATGIGADGKNRNVKIVLYPHSGTIYETTKEALELVEQVNDPRFTVAINLIHELRAGKGDELASTFEQAKGRIGAITITGVKNDDLNLCLPLNESDYDLRKFMRLIRDSDFKGPIGFVNFMIPENELPYPQDYLTTSMTTWETLCREEGLWEAVPQPPTVTITSPESEAVFTTSENVEVTVEAFDTNGINNVRLMLNDTIVESSLQAGIYVSDLWPLAAGRYTIQAVAFSNDIDPETGRMERTETEITITVNSEGNQPPGLVAYRQVLSTQEDRGLTIMLTGMNPNGDDDKLSFSIIDNPEHGQLSGTAPKVTYTPHSGFAGEDTFTFTVHDGTMKSAKAKVTITVEETTDVSNPGTTDDGGCGIAPTNGTSDVAWLILLLIPVLALRRRLS